MNELKTLKDIGYGFVETNWIGGEGFLGFTGVNKEELKHEAIKWIKQDIEDYRIADLDLPASPVGTNIHNFIVQQRQKWKDRLNITEEDLK